MHRVATALTEQIPLLATNFLGVRKFVDIEFDPVTDRANVIKHGISLLAAEEFDWDTALEPEDDRFDDGEVRFVALGMIRNRLHMLIFTEGSQADVIRPISLRLAEKHEVRFYHGHV